MKIKYVYVPFLIFIYDLEIGICFGIELDDIIIA